MKKEFKALKEAIEKRERHNKRHARSAGIKEIRKAFKAYEKSLGKSYSFNYWDRAKRYFLR